MALDDGGLIPGTFDMLILKALSLGANHGWGIADQIARLSGGVCSVKQGAIYPALQRLLLRGWLTASWRETDNSRRARFYKLTATGRQQLEDEMASWRRATAGVERLLRATA